MAASLLGCFVIDIPSAHPKLQLNPEPPTLDLNIKTLNPDNQVAASLLGRFVIDIPSGVVFSGMGPSDPREVR